MGLGRDGRGEEGRGRSGVRGEEERGGVRRGGKGGEGTFIVPKIVSPHTFLAPL